MIRQWRDLEPWIASEALDERQSRFPPTSVGTVLQPRKESVSLNGGFGEFAPITVHLDGEISVRDRSTPYKGAMFAAYPGDIVFSKIDARSGAIGLLPASIPKAVVTSEFPVFTADSAKLDSAFLQRILRTGHFLSALRKKATGTSGRKRITPEAFLELRVPLPPLDQQRAIVAAYQESVDQAAAKDAEAEGLEAKAMSEFEAALGFAPAAALPDKPIFVASFKDLDRWSHEGILRRVATETGSSSSWPIVRLGDVIGDLENGWSPKCLSRPAGPTEWGVLKLGAVSFGVFNENENKAIPTQLKPRPALEVKPGQVLISRANIARLVGATALIERTRSQLLLCDKIFRVVWRDRSLVTPQFVTEVLRVADLRRQIETKLTGTSPTMKNISKPSLLSLTFPLPPVEKQKELTDRITAERTKSARLRAESADIRKAAWELFEASIYSDPSA